MRSAVHRYEDGPGPEIATVDRRGTMERLRRLKLFTSGQSTDTAGSMNETIAAVAVSSTVNLGRNGQVSTVINVNRSGHWIVTIVIVSLVTIIVILTTLLTIAGRFYFIHQTKSSSDIGNLCLTPRCISMADQRLKVMNRSVDPCHDFYEYACGNSHSQASYAIRHNVSQFSTLDEAELLKLEVLRNELDHPSYEWSDIEKAVRKIYDSCTTQKMHTRPQKTYWILHFVQNIIKWDLESSLTFKNDTQNSSDVIAKKKKQKQWTLEDALIKVYSKNINPLMAITVIVDDFNTSRFVINIAEPLLVLVRRDFYVDDKNNILSHQTDTKLKIYFQILMETFNILNVSEEVAKAKAEKIIQFESRLAFIHMKDEQKKSSIGRKFRTTINELSRIVPQIHWKYLFDGMFHDIHIGEQEPIAIDGINWLKQLGSLVGLFNENDQQKQIVDDYIKWYSVWFMLRFVDKSIYNSEHQFIINVLHGIGTEKPKWIECLKLIEWLAPGPLSRIYVKAIKDHKSLGKASVIFNITKMAAMNEIENISWMGNKTRRLVHSKLSRMISLVGYPNHITSSIYPERGFYDLSKFSSVHFAHNAMVLLKSFHKSLLSNLHKKPDRSKWAAYRPSPLDVSGFYEFSLNRITIPFALMNHPFILSEGDLMVTDLGALGAIIGHEIFHSLDNVGRMYNEQGNYEENVWSEEELSHQRSRSRCFVDQYTEYLRKIKGDSKTRLMGEKSLNENIADNGGLKIMYKAFKKWKNDYSDQHQLLPGFGNMTLDQFFFLSFAQYWCSNKRLEPTTISDDTHSLPRYRVMGTLSNMPEFSDSFECPVGSDMNPANKCRLW